MAEETPTLSRSKVVCEIASKQVADLCSGLSGEPEVLLQTDDCLKRIDQSNNSAERNLDGMGRCNRCEPEQKSKA